MEDGSVCPFGEADGAVIEESYSDMIAGKEDGPIDCELVNTEIVRGVVNLSFQPIAVTDKNIAPVGSDVLTPSDSSDSLNKKQRRLVTALYRQSNEVPNPSGRSSRPGTPVVTVTKRCEMFRGFPDKFVPDNEDMLPDKVSWLIFMVHGIGEALINRQNDPEIGALRFRSHVEEVRHNLLNRSIEEYRARSSKVRNVHTLVVLRQLLQCMIIEQPGWYSSCGDWKS